MEGNNKQVDLNNSGATNESLGILSIQSNELSTTIENMRLKNTHQKLSVPYLMEQRALANKTLQDRQSKVSGLPSRYFKPSEASSTCSSYFELSKESTINESDLLMNQTSTPRESIDLVTPKVDIAESMMRMSLELRNPETSMDAAFEKLENEYLKIRESIATRNDSFRPLEEAQSQLIRDEQSWRREKGIPAEEIDFTVDSADASKMSIGAFFKQRTEDISEIIPSNRKENLNVSNLSSILEFPTKLSEMIPPPPPLPSEEDTLSISRIAKLLENDYENSPSKLLDYMLQYGKASKTNDKPNDEDEDSGNFHPSTLTSDKENFNSTNIPTYKLSDNIPKSPASVRSSSSLSNLPGGKLPIETTHYELVWGCVKAGKSETKYFTLRNRSSNRLRFQCVLSGPSFRVATENGSSTSKLLLHAYETKSLHVTFNPLKEGAAIDELVFIPCDADLQQLKKQSVRLFGYGGTAKVEFTDVLKESTGKYCLSLGQVALGGGKSVISKTITVSNSGTLTAFAFFEYLFKQVTFSGISIDPEFLILAPNEQKTVLITCSLTREDIRYLPKNPIQDMGSIKFVAGAEALRGRIRRVRNLATEKKLEVDTFVEKLIKEVPGEAIPTDIIKYKETVNSMKYLLQSLSHKEILIMMEKDLDTTLVPSLSDETSMFHSFCDQSTIIEDSSDNCKLEPSSLIFTSTKLKDCLLLTSKRDAPVKFEFTAPNSVSLNPSSGRLMPHETRVIQIQVDKCKKGTFVVSVAIGGNVYNCDVKVLSF